MRSAADRTRHLIQRIVTMVAVVAGGALLLNMLAHLSGLLRMASSLLNDGGDATR